MEQARWLLADQVDAAGVVDVVDVVPANSFCSVFLLKKPREIIILFDYIIIIILSLLLYYIQCWVQTARKGKIQRVSWQRLDV